MNYAEYMKAENPKAAHEQFYSEIAQEAGVKISAKLAQETRQAIADGDEHLNTIKLERWDLIAEMWRHRIALVLRERGSHYTLSQGVCTVKAAARAAAQTLKA